MESESTLGSVPESHVTDGVHGISDNRQTRIAKPETAVPCNSGSLQKLSEDRDVIVSAKGNDNSAESTETRSIQSSDFPNVKEEDVQKVSRTESWGGWGNWNSMFTALQEVATATMEAVEANVLEPDIAVLKDKEAEGEISGEENKALLNDETHKRSRTVQEGQGNRSDAAAKSSPIGKGLHDLDSSVEHMASDALHALGYMWQGSVGLVHRLQQEGSIAENVSQMAPSILESGRGLAERSLDFLEYVSKETVEIIAKEAGITLEEDDEEKGKQEQAVSTSMADEDADGVGEDADDSEDVEFEHCFYIYGGPEHLEELEALANHHSLVYSRALSKLSAEEKSTCESLEEEIKNLLCSAALEDSGQGSSGQGVSSRTPASLLLDKSWSEVKKEIVSLKESCADSAKELSSGFSERLEGMAESEARRRSIEQMASIKTEGVHRISEISAVCLSTLLEFSRALLATPNATEESTNGDESDESSILNSSGRQAAAGMDGANFVKLIGVEMKAHVNEVAEFFISGLQTAMLAYEETTLQPSGSAAENSTVEEPKGLLQVRNQNLILQDELKISAGKGEEKLKSSLQLLPSLLLSWAVRNTATITPETC